MCMIFCPKCGKKNLILEIKELKDTKLFTSRYLIIGKCRSCNQTIVNLIEIRKSDNVTFIDKAYGRKAEKIIKSTSKDFKVKYNKKEDLRFYGWVYGINKDIKNNKGLIVASRQYSSDFITNRTHYEKEIKNKY